MSLGIITRYQSHEATHAAVRIASWAADKGYDVSIYSITPQSVAVDEHWDNEVIKQKDKRFTDWAKNRSTIIWTHIPPMEQVKWAKRRGIKTILFCLWHEVTPYDREVVQEMTALLSPHISVTRFYSRKLGAKKIYTAPWDTGLPFTAKDPRIESNYKWMLLPLYDQEPNKTEMTAIEVAGRALDRNDDTVLTVMYNASTISSPCKRRLYKFRQFFGTRVRLLPSVPAWKRPLVFRQHDLTIWPTQQENIGLVGITSITMGTPVIAFKNSPLEDVLNKENSVLISCKEEIKPSGVPSASADYAAFEGALDDLLRNNSLLHKLQQSVLYGLPARRERFNTVMQNVYSA
jgi:hypothetical protein